MKPKIYRYLAFKSSQIRKLASTANYAATRPPAGKSAPTQAEVRKAQVAA